MNFVKSQQYAFLLEVIATGYPALLIGQTGVGKTTAAYEAAKETGRRVVSLDLYDGTNFETLFVKTVQRNGLWVEEDQPLLTAYAEGGALILFNEVFSPPPSELHVLHAIFGREPITIGDRTIVCHPTTAIVGTANPPGVYAGNTLPSTALCDRAQIIRWEPPSVQDITQKYVSEYGLAPALAGAVVRLAQEWNHINAGAYEISFRGMNRLFAFYAKWVAEIPSPNDVAAQNCFVRALRQTVLLPCSIQAPHLLEDLIGVTTKTFKTLPPDAFNDLLQ